MTGPGRGGREIKVHVPADLPALNASTCRILLGILVKLTKTEIREDLPEKGAE
ncbi:hypothetical protein SAMN05421630_110240 [Prauserella marina]|uniref:Uncharacterized protein n=1 Tax=Prauserella marina TaxID=530584 RepID=A0A1G6WAP4_9PSEU|nr:hypothetical protein [Prauserella marina]PWV74065.1 hypothetical protein DES30_108239 [Prauserella marina]SDD62126.1 hypothetical protein SAMN05421630_110240 [Prauserella marina]